MSSGEEKNQSQVQSKPMSLMTKILIGLAVVVILIILGISAYLGFETKMAEIRVASKGVDDLSKLGQEWMNK